MKVKANSTNLGTVVVVAEGNDPPDLVYISFPSMYFSAADFA